MFQQMMASMMHGGASRHSSLGSGATRFSQVSPMMMGNAAAKFRLATPRAIEPAPSHASSVADVPPSDVMLADIDAEDDVTLAIGDVVDEDAHDDDEDDAEIKDIEPTAASHAIVPVPDITAIVDMTARDSSHSLLAKVESEMLSAHKARDTKRGKYDKKMKDAVASQTPVEH